MWRLRSVISDAMFGAKTVKNRARIVCAAAVISLCTVNAAHAETETVEAQVAIVQRGEFFKVEDLNFGAVIPSGTAGTVVVSPDGVRTRTGGVTLYGINFHPAEFAGRKPAGGNPPVLLSLGSNTIQLTGPGAPMTVRLFRGNTNPGQVLTSTPNNFQVQGTSAGAFELRIGATLDVNANQAPGTYTGTWSLTLDFQ
jgi:hypothetical protein